MFGEKHFCTHVLLFLQDHANYNPFLRSLYFDHDPDGPNPGELLQAQAMKQEKRGPGALLDKDNTVPDNHVSNAWENVFPRAIKRRAAGKLCYINPIACFGRRQRHAWTTVNKLLLWLKPFSPSMKYSGGNLGTEYRFFVFVNVWMGRGQSQVTLGVGR